MHGNIYPPDEVPHALANFFRTDNLTALRELALRFLADETEEQLLEYLRRPAEGLLWETHERILVGVTAAPGTDAIVRRASRMAARIKATSTSFTSPPASGPTTPSDQLVALRQLATDVGAAWTELGTTTPPTPSSSSPSTTGHPDRGRLERPQPLAGADGWGLDRPEDLAPGPREADRRAHHRPAGCRLELAGGDEEAAAHNYGVEPGAGFTFAGASARRPA